MKPKDTRLCTCCFVGFVSGLYSLLRSLRSSGQWIESATDWAIRITDRGLFPDWVSSHARLADPIRPMPSKGKSGHSGLPMALISRLPDWVVQSVHRLLHRLYPLARKNTFWVPPPVYIFVRCLCYDGF